MYIVKHKSTGLIAGTFKTLESAIEYMNKGGRSNYKRKKVKKDL